MFRRPAENYVDKLDLLSLAHRSDSLGDAQDEHNPRREMGAHDISVDASLSINHSRRMDISRATMIMSALAQPTRLRTFKLLVEHGAPGMASGAIAAAVGAPQNTMSSHLTILTHAGLVRREPEGRVVRYTAVVDDVAELGPFLTAGWKASDDTATS